MPARFTHTHSVTADGDRIGRWSMLDLFVISLTMSLINRDQILALLWDRLRFISAQR